MMQAMGALLVPAAGLSARCFRRDAGRADCGEATSSDRRAGLLHAGRLRSRAGPGHRPGDGAGAPARAEHPQPLWLSRRPGRGARRPPQRDVCRPGGARDFRGARRLGLRPDPAASRFRPDPRQSEAADRFQRHHRASPGACRAHGLPHHPRPQCGERLGPTLLGFLPPPRLRRRDADLAQPGRDRGSPGPAQRTDPHLPARPRERPAARRQPHRSLGVGRDALFARASTARSCSSRKPRKRNIASIAC